jgi:hypothetical protein
VTPSTDWKETIPDGEEALLARLAGELGALQAARKQGDRALHAKQHAALRATLTVEDKLPDHARQGLFARPGKHRAYLRLSNGSGSRAHDRVPDVRGLALKILGVDGPKALGEARTQDILVIDGDRMPVATPAEFVTLVRAASGKRLLRTLVGELGLLRTLKLVARVARGLKGKPNDLLDVTFNTVVPVAFGPYAARVQLVPQHEPSPRRSPGERDYIATRVAERVAAAPLRWEVRAQFYTGAQTPIEDPQVNWPSPYLRLGLLETVPTTRAAELTAFVDSLSFDPWHALVEHRPLGAIMRARKHAYFTSTKARNAAPEPDGTEWEGWQ